MRNLIFMFFAALIVMSANSVRAQTNSHPITRETVVEAQRLIGLDFSEAKIDMMLPDLEEQREAFEQLRKFPLSNAVPSAMLFNPIPVGMKMETGRSKFRMSRLGKVKLPENRDELAFYSVEELGSLIKSRRITSERLTRLYLERLKKYGPKLHCVVTLTEELALKQARRADREIAAGKYRGVLHGIPFGVKDLLATKGIPTTWGSAAYRDQIFDEDATVVKRLEAAGAVLVAKLSMGELAWGDVWFGGMTRNPWNMKEGSGGSSAGPGAATAAGLVAFSIGSETHGSIVDPCARCGVTGLRPTYGRVSRNGAMALSWSMDKLGPICRTVEDCAVVFNAIYGPDGLDQTVYDVPFNYDPRIKLRDLKIGYLKGDFDAAKRTNDLATLARLRELGATLVPLELPRIPLKEISFVLSTEAAAAFDDLTRSCRDDLMVRQIRNAWPNVFRSHRFIPAVEYIQANRVRYLLIQETAAALKDLDLFIAPSFDGTSEHLTNLTGHPCVVLPNGFDESGMPTSICFIGRLFGEGKLLAAARVYQEATGFQKRHPRME
jgi:Asp-tRNA(Asn)/Glu-tRNA(Gln) amidotransferase A subunit family amidase